jgi:hypothetical protein
MHPRRYLLPLAAALLVAALAVPLPAADAPFDAATAAWRLAPFLDEQAFAVARVDLTGLNLNDIADRLARLTGLDAGQFAPARRAARDVTDRFRQAGARELYAVVSLADLPMPGPFVLVPLGEGANADEVRRALSVLGTETVETIHGVVFAGGKAARERLRGLKPAARPGLESALAAVAATPVQLVFVPGPDLRRIVEETMPKLPPQVGGGPSTILTHGVRWAALGLETKPKLALKLTVQSKDAAAARALADAAGRGLRWAAQQEEARRVLPKMDELVTALTPQVTGDRLTLTIDESAPVVAQASATLLARARSAAGRAQSSNNLKQIALAWHNYHDVHKAFPADIKSKDGKPLLSWRVAILPFVAQDNLYKQFKLDEPWDSEHNKALIARMPATYHSPAQKAGDGKTTYLAPRGQTGPDGAVKIGVLGAPIKEVTDGTSNTIMVVEANDEAAAVWTKPGDLDVDSKEPLKGLIGHYDEGFVAALADGSVRFISKKVNAATLLGAFTRNGGEVLGRDW